MSIVVHARLLTAEEVAERIGFSVQTVLSWAYGRKPAPLGFPRPVKISNRLRWVEADILSYIEALSVKEPTFPAPPPPKPKRGRPRKGNPVSA